MTYLELYEDALRKLHNSLITLGEFEMMVKPLDREVEAESEADWIPCSERLPENSGRYIVTLKDILAITVRVAVYGVMPHDTHNKKVFWLYDSCYDDLDITEDVVAWMPLPEPYREDGK